MCVLCVCLSRSYEYMLCLLQTQHAHRKRAENWLGSKIPVVLALASFDSHHNKQTYKTVFSLMCLKYALTLQCVKMRVSY